MVHADEQEAFAVFGDETNVRHDHVNARIILVTELHAQIDHKPIARVGWPHAITIAIHANLAGATQGEKHQVFALI